MKHSKIILIASITAFLMNSSYAQDVRNTQSFWSNPLKVNPAIMGMNTDLKVILNYRSQWGSIDDGYTTASFSALYPLYLKDGSNKLDMGLNVLSDKEGAFSTMDFSLAVGYNLKVSTSGYISFSLLGGYVQKSLDVTNQTFDEQYILGSYSSSNTHNETILNDKASYPDVGFGMMWYLIPSNEGAKLNAYIGASGYHLNQPNETFVEGTGILPRRISYQGGIKIIGEKKLDFTPNIRVNTQNGSEEVAAGLYVDYKLNETGKIVVGSWYRKKDAIAFLLGFEHQSFIIGYSYDASISPISTSISGLSTHEITLSYKMDMAGKKGLTAIPSFF